MRRVMGRDVIGHDNQDVSDVTERDLVLRACDEVLKMRADLAAHTITENEFHAKFGKVFVDLGTLFGRVDKIEKGYRRHSTSLLPPMRAPLDSSMSLAEDIVNESNAKIETEKRRPSTPPPDESKIRKEATADAILRIKAGYWDELTKYRRAAIVGTATTILAIVTMIVREVLSKH